MASPHPIAPPFLALLAALVLSGSLAAQAEQHLTPTPTRKGYVPTSGISYYYEIYGRGDPLLLLHGGLGSIEMFAPSCQSWRRAGR